MIRQVCVAILIAAVARPTAAEEAAFAFDMHEAPIAGPDLRFADADGSVLTLDAYRGRVLLLNIWATWCAPCREELPALDALQRALGGASFEVIALSTDTGRRPAVERLFVEVSVTDLRALIDDTGSAMRDLGIYALPTTLLIDEDGQEIGRVIGPADWDSPNAIKFFEELP